MTRSLDICDKWIETIFESDEIREITPNIYAEDVAGNQLVACDLSQAMHEGTINFCQFSVQRIKREDQVGECGTYFYRVDIRYFLERLAGMRTEQKVQEFFEVLDELIQSELGSDWGGLVDSYTRSEEFPEVFQFGLINERPVVAGRYTYFAEKN